MNFGIHLWTFIYYLLIFSVVILGMRFFDVFPLEMAVYGWILAYAAYLLLSISFHRLYHALNVGQSRVSELILSQTLSNLITAGIMYICAALYNHALFSPLPLIAVLAVQALISVAWCISANRVFLQKNRPLRTAIVYTNDEYLQQLLDTNYFSEKYNVVRKIKDPEDDVQKVVAQLDDCEAVFTVGVSSSMSNSIAKFCVEKNIKGYFVPYLGHIIMSGAQYMSGFNMPILHVTRTGGYIPYRFVKRTMDIVMSSAALILTLPVMVVTALCIWLDDHGPVFYKQTRLTKDGKEFSILKFRSMSVSAEHDGVARLASANDSRITRVGKFIRSCRIDELPQLINILKGDMSIVGPRPERPEIAKEYEKTLPEFSLRLQVKAGLTGQAQVYGRYNTTPYTKLQMDLMYITQMSFLLDLRLIFATFKILFVKDSTQGVQEGQMTAMATENGVATPHGKSA